MNDEWRINDERLTWFCIGFAATREGFNGECSFDHLSPEDVFGGRGEWNRDEINDLKKHPDLVRLFEKELAAQKGNDTS